MTDASCVTATAEGRRSGVLLSILSTVAFTFATYLTIGLSLAVLPGFVHSTLGYGAMLAGLAISMQYVATLISRPHAGRMADALGPKRTVITGLAMCAASGVLLLLGALAVSIPLLSLGLILIARLALGCAESCVGTGSIAWGMGQVGHHHTANVRHCVPWLLASCLMAWAWHSAPSVSAASLPSSHCSTRRTVGLVQRSP